MPLIFDERSFFMKIVRTNYGAMDVRKNSVVATIGIADIKIQITERFQETLSTLNPDLLILKR